MDDELEQEQNQIPSVASAGDGTEMLSSAAAAAAFVGFQNTIDAIVANLEQGAGIGTEGQEGQQANPENAEGETSPQDRLTLIEEDINSLRDGLKSEAGGVRRNSERISALENKQSEDDLHRDLSNGEFNPY